MVGGENMDFMTLVSMPVITAMAMIIVAIISFITGRLNEKYKTNLEYRTFLDIEEILSSYNVGNSPTAKVGTKLLLPLSYKKLLNFLMERRLDSDPDFIKSNRFNYLKIRILGKSIIIGGEVKIIFENNENTLIEMNLPLLQPNEEIYIPLDISFNNLWGNPEPIKEIEIKYRLQTGQSMRFMSKRTQQDHGETRTDSYEILKFFKYQKIHKYNGNDASWMYTANHE